MAYLDRTPDPRRRGIAVAGVVAIHALLGYVLLTGLVQTFIPHREHPLTSYFEPEPQATPTPEPSPEPTQEARQETIVAPQPPVDISSDSRVDVVPMDEVPIDQPIRLVIADPIPKPLPPPIFTPRPPAPANDPGHWALTEDYPARDLREGNQGVTAFRLVIGSNGKVSACEVTRSSGFPGLDAATCKYVSRRARFDPATDRNGQKVVGTYSSSVRWEIPR